MKNTTIQVGDIVEPIPGYYNTGFMGTVVKLIDDQSCIVRFTSEKVKPIEQLRTIDKLIKRGRND
jgi:hypothetical protein